MIWKPKVLDLIPVGLIEHNFNRIVNGFTQIILFIFYDS